MSAPIDEYRDKSAIIRFDGKKCIHSRNCVLTRPDVFIPNAPGAWIQPDNASVEQVALLGQICPSGAITYERLDGGEPEPAPKVNVVTVRENGPLAVRATIQLDGAGGTPDSSGATYRATLCRCGASKNKPYCDGAHATCGFQATGEPTTQDSPALAERGGPLQIKPAPNGPLLVTGNVEICSGTGRTVLRTQKTALCRCGASANKPYCDGTHNKISFRSDV